MKKEVLKIKLALTAMLLLAMPTRAAMIGDITASASGLTNIAGFDGAPVTIDDNYSYVFIGTMETLDGGAIVTVSYEFFDDVLYSDISRSSGTGTIPGFSVTFSGIDWLDPFIGHSLSGYDIINDISPPAGEEEGFGLVVTRGSDWLTLTYSSYDLTDGRTMDIQLLHTGTSAPSVVPVPAAAPMTLLGLGVLALARRFRQKKS